MNEEYLSVEDVVARYKGKITKGTLANWRIQRDGPPYIKLGGRVMYPLAGLVEWEKARTVRTTGGAITTVAAAAYSAAMWGAAVVADLPIIA